MWYSLSGPDNRIIPPKHLQDLRILAYFFNKHATSFTFTDFNLSSGGLSINKSDTGEFKLHECQSGNVFVNSDYGVIDIGPVLELIGPELYGFKTVLCVNPDSEGNCTYVHRMFVFQLPDHMQTAYQNFTRGMF